MAESAIQQQRLADSTEGISKYGASSEPPRDDAVIYPEDDMHSFFARGRDFESTYINHKYTTQERQTLASFESLDYLPSHSKVYRHWIKKQPARLDWDRWVMMGLIGLSVGLIGFLLHQIIDVIVYNKWRLVRKYIEDNNLFAAWIGVTGFSLTLVTISAGLVVFLRPSAAGSGIPELIGFLNGTIIRHIFNVKTMVIKFLSCCCAVGSGMPVGPEGPMIHLGSLVGAGLSQFKSDTLKFKMPFFERFRNSEDRRNFVSAGAAAGVASAFGAPVGGLLFSMEEVSSFWNQKLSWQIFFCAMVSTFTTDLFNSAFTGFEYSGQFGLFKADKYILFQVETGLAVNILAFIPAVILGIIGGVLGALFTFINLKIARSRKRILSNIKCKWKQNLLRMIEPLLIMTVMASVSVFLPAAFPCSQYVCMHGKSGHISQNCLNDTLNALHVDPMVERYTCPEGIDIGRENYTWTNKTFNEMATLMFVTGEEAIHHLFSRNTHLEFGYATLFSVLPIYFLMSCWAAGTSISSGIVVPMLFTGGVYGRIIGRVMVSVFGVHTQKDSYWAWMDPGAFALVGAASFFGGVSRLTMSLTVIMMEITNDVQFLLPIMATIMVAKWVGDNITHPLYHALLELKCIPFLDAEPVILHEGKHVISLELFSAGDIMTAKPLTLHTEECVSGLAQLLLEINHGGFPVVKQTESGDQVFHGFINRLELIVLLSNEDIFQTAEDLQNQRNEDISYIDYQYLTLDKLSNPAVTQETLQHYVDNPMYENLYLNLELYINQSAISIQEKFSLHRTYIIFRTLGLRHLTVVDSKNSVVGIITRKDLMGFNMEEKVAHILQRMLMNSQRSIELSDNIENVNVNF